MLKFPANTIKERRIILSLGGSLITPSKIDTGYLSLFRKFILKKIRLGWKFVIVAGGGSVARDYINAGRKILDHGLNKEDMDWLGIHATRLNAYLIRTIFRDEAQPRIITNPEQDMIDKAKNVVVAAGWKPGWSTDYIATKIAQRLGNKVVVNLSNIKQVYESDPRQNPNARAIEKISWRRFRKIIGNVWVPGASLPFGPVAARLAQQENITVVIMSGDLSNFDKFLSQKKFVGTIVAN